MLHVLEVAVGRRTPIASARSSRTFSVAASQPRLFKQVLPMVVEGMAQLGSAHLDADLVSPARAAAHPGRGRGRLCSKHANFVERVLKVLLPMLLRLGGDLSEWEAAMPEDGSRGR